MWIWCVFLLAGGLLALGCEVDDQGDDDDDAADDDASDDDTGDDDVAPAEATVSGEVGRSFSTCPPNIDGVGDLYFFLMDNCGDELTDARVTAMLPSADLGWPETMIPFEITEVPDGTFQLYAYLDDDSSGPGGGTEGDLENTICVEVTVTDQQDVTGVSLMLNDKCPY